MGLSQSDISIGCGKPLGTDTHSSAEEATDPRSALDLIVNGSKKASLLRPNFLWSLQEVAKEALYWNWPKEQALRHADLLITERSPHFNLPY